MLESKDCEEPIPEEGPDPEFERILMSDGVNEKEFVLFWLQSIEFLVFKSIINRCSRILVSLTLKVVKDVTISGGENHRRVE